MKSASSLVKDWLINRGDVSLTFTAWDICKELQPIDSRVTYSVVSGYLSKMLQAKALEASRQGRKFHYWIRDFSILVGRGTHAAPVPQPKPAPKLLFPPPFFPTMSMPAQAAIPSVSAAPAAPDSIHNRLLEIAAEIETYTTPLSRYATPDLLAEVARRTVR